MKKRKDLKVLVIEPGKVPYVKVIDNTLESLQAEVGGYIEQVSIFEDPVTILCNEDGKRLGLPKNRGLYDNKGVMRDIILGTFIIVGIGTEDFISLTEEQIEKYTNHYGKPELWFAWEGDDLVYNDEKMFNKNQKNHHSKPLLRRYSIYQLKNDETSAVPQLMFCENYNYFQNAYFSVESTNYKLVYFGHMADDEDLNTIKRRFSSEILPDDFDGHMLSTSDVIVLTEDDKRIAYFVENGGFREIPDFFTREETNITAETTNQEITGLSGKWDTVAMTWIEGNYFFLMHSAEHPEGDIIVDAHGTLIMQRVTNGLDDYALHWIEVEIMPVEKMPDMAITVHQMKNYGYSWGGMLPLTAKRAHDLFRHNLPVYHLRQDDTESLLTKEIQIDLLAANGDIFGIEKLAWKKVWEESNKKDRAALFYGAERLG